MFARREARLLASGRSSAAQEIRRGVRLSPQRGRRRLLKNAGMTRGKRSFAAEREARPARSLRPGNAARLERKQPSGYARLVKSQDVV
jgi:hypothetical protein